jgi:hypothetical protein
LSEAYREWAMPESVPCGHDANVWASQDAYKPTKISAGYLRKPRSQRPGVTSSPACRNAEDMWANWLAREQLFASPQP